VGGHIEDGPRLTVREGAPADEPFVVALGTAAFARFGEYADVMKGFLQSPEVEALIAWEAGHRVGFALLDRPPDHPGIADLVAIAVDPGRRRAGVGRALLEAVIASCAERSGRSVLVLTVAEDNLPAIELFRSFEFSMAPGSLGRYAGGQTSRRMIRAV
jgi:ribosomal-protein-alanine N-acetyltransferase